MNETHDPHLETFRRAGETLGIINGRRAAENAAFADAYKSSFHIQIQAAGLCDCAPAQDFDIDDKQVHVVPADGLSDALRQILTLGRPTPPPTLEEQLSDAYTLTDEGRAVAENMPENMPNEPAGDVPDNGQQ